MSDPEQGGATGDLLLTVRVIPNAARNEVVGWHGDALKIKVQAPPEGGRANAAVLATLAAAVDLPVRRLELVRGEKSRQKQVRIEGLPAAVLRARLKG